MNSSVSTFCIGKAQSGAAIILAAGDKGKRHALPHAKIMLHQPWGGVTGQASDIKIQAEEIVKAKKMLNEILAKHTGLTSELGDQVVQVEVDVGPAGVVPVASAVKVPVRAGVAAPDQARVRTADVQVDRVAVDCIPKE